jgi:hypothetical protein
MYSRPYSPHVKSCYTDLTVTQARTMRAHHARLAAASAERVEEARAAADFAQMAQWLREYKRATVRCRVLGDVIRKQRPGGPEDATEQPPAPISTAGRRTPGRPRGGTPTTGAAA